MSVRSASGIGLGGALRSPQILGGMTLAAVIALAVVFVAVRQNEGNAPASRPAASVPEAVVQPRFNAGGDTLPATVYIVTSEAAAETLRRAIGEADNIRAVQGLAPSSDTIAVVASEAEAAELEAAIIDGNSVLAGLGKPPLTVVRPNLGIVESAPAASPLTMEEAIAQHENALDAVLGQR